MHIYGFGNICMRQKFLHMFPNRNKQALQTLVLSLLSLALLNSGCTCVCVRTRVCLFYKIMVSTWHAISVHISSLHQKRINSLLVWQCWLWTIWWSRWHSSKIYCFERYYTQCIEEGSKGMNHLQQCTGWLTFPFFTSRATGNHNTWHWVTKLLNLKVATLPSPCETSLLLDTLLLKSL